MESQFNDDKLYAGFNTMSISLIISFLLIATV